MRRDPRQARVLGLWTACWLAGFLVAGLLWLGEPGVQWLVLAVPLLWALVALRPRRRPAADPGWDDQQWDDDQQWHDDRQWHEDRQWDDREGDDDRWDDRHGDGQHWDGQQWQDDGWDADEPGRPGSVPDRYPPPGERTDTVERPSLRRPEDDDPWGRGRRR